MKFTARCNKHNCSLRSRFDGHVFVAQKDDGTFELLPTGFFCPQGAPAWRSSICSDSWVILPLRAEWFAAHKDFVRQQLMEDAEAIADTSNTVDEDTSLQHKDPQGL